MINYIWFIILGIGIVFGIATGRGDVLSIAVMDSASQTVKLIISLMGILCLWCGVIKIAEKSGLMENIAKIMKPFIKKIFKEAGRDDKAISNIVMNMTANMLGLSNAATPFGIKAMEELKRINPKKDTASDDMALFLVVNACCVQLVPTTIISLRAASGSKNPAEIIIPAIITTAIAAFIGIIICKILEKFF